MWSPSLILQSIKVLALIQEFEESDKREGGQWRGGDIRRRWCRGRSFAKCKWWPQWRPQRRVMRADLPHTRSTYYGDEQLFKEINMKKTITETDKKRKGWVHEVGEVVAHPSVEEAQHAQLKSWEVLSARFPNFTFDSKLEHTWHSKVSTKNDGFGCVEEIHSILRGGQDIIKVISFILIFELCEEASVSFHLTSVNSWSIVLTINKDMVYNRRKWRRARENEMVHWREEKNEAALEEYNRRETHKENVQDRTHRPQKLKFQNVKHHWELETATANWYASNDS